MSWLISMLLVQCLEANERPGNHSPNLSYFFGIGLLLLMLVTDYMTTCWPMRGLENSCKRRVHSTEIIWMPRLLQIDDLFAFGPFEGFTGLYILVTPTDSCSVLHLFSVPDSWEDFTDLFSFQEINSSSWIKGPVVKSFMRQVAIIETHGGPWKF